jgi:hypothetical protein
MDLILRELLLQPVVLPVTALSVTMPAHQAQVLPQPVEQAARAAQEAQAAQLMPVAL